MSDYTPTTDFSVKDGLTSGDANKLITGSSVDVEFDAISTAIATKANKVTSPTTNNLAKLDVNGDLVEATSIKDDGLEVSIATGRTFNVTDVGGLEIGGVSITATAAELNIMDADAALSTPTVASGDGFVMNDADVGMVQVDIDNVDTYLAQTTKTLTNKTLTSPAINTPTVTSPVLNTGVSGTAILDQDDMSSNSATQLATQQSIKAYVDLSSGRALQEVYTASSALATTTTTIPKDDTIPQNTEGVEVFTRAITPKSASNILRIQASVIVATSLAYDAVIALFQDSTASALAASSVRCDTANMPYVVKIDHWMVAGTASATTFKIRVGPSASSTLTINGASAARLWGGVANSIISVTEYAI